MFGSWLDASFNSYTYHIRHTLFSSTVHFLVFRASVRRVRLSSETHNYGRSLIFHQCDVCVVHLASEWSFYESNEEIDLFVLMPPFLWRTCWQHFVKPDIFTNNEFKWNIGHTSLKNRTNFAGQYNIPNSSLIFSLFFHSKIRQILKSSFHWTCDTLEHLRATVRGEVCVS